MRVENRLLPGNEIMFFFAPEAQRKLRFQIIKSVHNSHTQKAYNGKKFHRGSELDSNSRPASDADSHVDFSIGPQFRDQTPVSIQTDSRLNFETDSRPDSDIKRDPNLDPKRNCDIKPHPITNLFLYHTLTPTLIT
ncbi:hypothetical protein EVAR_90198_1 [Eumeta japonica]|uniref:Uncharacterized protein n=1 Tax=Eumeta variegata TaxID=151549 RepID=A0A4C1WUG2_EUMVA|nr:hypothetical protein EVAR_90198_1 [Eumeta japonica]